MTRNENCELLVQKLAEQISYPIDSKDTKVCHRVSLAHNTTEKNIIVRFVSRKVRNEFYQRAKKARLSTDVLAFSSVIKQAIYVNEHLTRENKKLLAEALKRKKEKKWMFVWTDQGQTKARKPTDSPVVRVTCEADLSRIS